MDFWKNDIVMNNLTDIFEAFILAFILSFLLTPLAGKLATKIGAIDLPANMRLKTDRSTSSRINSEPKPRLGGLAVWLSIILSIFLTNSFEGINKGIFAGILIIGLLGFLDDKFEISGGTQISLQVLAAFAVIVSGLRVEQVNFLDINFSFNWLEIQLPQILNYAYTFIFPADILTILWIVGIINVVNWVGGVDGLNISISSIASFTLLLFVFESPVFSVVLATLIAIHIGANLGLLPYNYNPSKIIPGAIGDYLNGYLLSVFAILTGTRWTATFILFGMIIIDALLVMYIRMKTHKGLLKNPLKVLSISDQNHLHHRLMAAGYSRKAVLLIEILMMTALCTIAVILGIDPEEQSGKIIISFAIATTFIIASFTLIFVLKQRAEKKKQRNLISNLHNEPQKEAVVNVIIDTDGNKEEEEDYERFVY